MTEPVTIIVGAEDQATVNLKKIGNAVDGVEGSIDSMGERSAAAGVDIAGMLEQFAGDEIGGFIDQLQNVSGTLRDHNEQVEAGNKGLGIYKVALAAAALEGGRRFGEWLSGAKDDLASFDKGLERSIDLQNQMFESRDKQSQAGQQKLSIIGDPQEQKAVLEEMIAKAEQAHEGARLASKETFRQLQEWEPSVNFADFSDEANKSFARLTGNKVLKMLENNADEANESTKDYFDRLVSLRSQLDEVTEAAEKQADAFKNQANADHQKQVDSIIESLQKERDALEMSNAQLDIRAANLNFASYPEIQQIELLHSSIDARKQAIQLEKQQAANNRAAQLKKENEALSERNRLEMEAQRIVDSNLTLKERFDQDISQLKALIVEGLLDSEQVKREGEKLKKGVMDSLRDQVKTVQSDIPENRAFQSRALAGVSKVDPATEAKGQRDKIEKRLSRANEYAEQSVAVLMEIAANQQGKNRRVVGL